MIRNEQDLQRANIRVAWQFASKMPPEAFEELCHVTAEQMRKDAGLTDEPVPLAPAAA